MTGPVIGDQSAADRLLQQVAQQRWRPDDPPPPSPRQVAMVLSALADHTALEAARVHDRMERRLPGDVDPPREDPFWPTSLSIGRWLHAVSDAIRRDKP